MLADRGSPAALALVVVRRLRALCGRDFEVVAEDFVVADPRAADTGALAFAQLEGRDPLAGIAGQGAMLVQLDRDARLDHALFEDGRAVAERRANVRDSFGRWIGRCFGEQARQVSSRGQSALDAWNALETDRQGQALARHEQLLA